MKTLSITLLALVMIALGSAPAVAADDCKMRQGEIDRAYGKRFDKQATKVRAIAAEGSKLCASGKTKEAMMKYDEASKEAGLATNKK